MEYADAAAKIAALTDPNDPGGSAARIMAAMDQDPDLYESFKEGKVGNPITVRTGVDGQRMADAMLAAVPQRTQKWVDGMLSPRANPQTAAVAAAGAWATGVQAAIQRNAYAAGVRGYNLDQAINTAVSDNGAAWAAGIAKRRDKITAAMQRTAQELTAASAAVRAMPKDTLAQRIARSAAMQQAMADAKVRRTGGTGAPAR